MAVRKLAISVPEDVLEQIDRAAAERGATRSGFISAVLRRVARARSDAEISRRVDELFRDPSLARGQRRTAAAFRSIEPTDGLEW